MDETWVQLILVGAAAVTALGVLWTKAIRPAIHFVSLTERMFPLLQELTDVFTGEDNAFDVLKEIVQQVRTDSGSSLLDIVNRIETASTSAAEVAQKLEVDLAADRQLSERDRKELRELTFQVRDAARLAKGVAENLAIAKTKVESVAVDLSESHDRANEAEGEPGAAADAAAQNPST